MSYIQFSEEEIKDKLERYKCCLANLGYAIFQASKYSPEQEKCLRQKFYYLRYAIQAIQRYLGVQQRVSLKFNFTALSLSYPADITFDFRLNSALKISKDLTVSSLQDLITQVLDTLNTDPVSPFISTAGGANEIIVQTDLTEDEYISSEIDISSTTSGASFGTLNPTDSTYGFDYSILSSSLSDFNFRSIKNTSDNKIWNLISDGVSIINIYDPVNYTLDDSIQISSPNDLPVLIQSFDFDPVSKIFYVSYYEIASGDSYACMINGNTSSVNYKQVSGQTLRSFNGSIKYNSINQQVYLSDGNDVIIMDDTLNDVTSFNIGSGVSDNIDILDVHSSGDVFVASQSTDEILRIDGNSLSGNFNTVIDSISVLSPVKIHLNGDYVGVLKTNGSYFDFQYMDFLGNAPFTLSNVNSNGFCLDSTYLYLAKLHSTYNNPSTDSELSIIKLSDGSTFQSFTYPPGSLTGCDIIGSKIMFSLSGQFSQGDNPFPLQVVLLDNEFVNNDNITFTFTPDGGFAQATLDVNIGTQTLNYGSTSLQSATPTRAIFETNLIAGKTYQADVRVLVRNASTYIDLDYGTVSLFHIYANSEEIPTTYTWTFVPTVDSTTFRITFGKFQGIDQTAVLEFIRITLVDDTLGYFQIISPDRTSVGFTPTVSQQSPDLCSLTLDQVYSIIENNDGICCDSCQTSQKLVQDI